MPFGVWQTKQSKQKTKQKKSPSNKQTQQETKSSHHVCWDCTKWEHQMNELSLKTVFISP